MTIIFPIIVLFLNTSDSLPVMHNKNVYGSDSILLIKNYWHTGIVLQVEQVKSFIPELKHFHNFRYIDIGWGDEEFYQHPGFDAGLAVKALFYPTASALRVEGFNYDIEKYVELSDRSVLIKINELQLKSICEYISRSFYKDAQKQVVQLSSRYGGNIRFYKAVGEYHLFNTCNTWIAGGLNGAGISINEHIILAEQLFNEAAEAGEVLK